VSSATGETNLNTLLASLQPHLMPGVFVFCSLPLDASPPTDVAPICQFKEAEGLTLIVEKHDADRAHLTYQFPCRLITLTVHSSLTAVGLLAAIAQALAAENISVNAVSAYYHDHLFVPCDRVDAAMACLQRLMQSGAALRKP
jgi:hypothetical protein